MARSSRKTGNKIELLKNKLADINHSMRWFYDTYISDSGMDYRDFLISGAN